MAGYFDDIPAGAFDDIPTEIRPTTDGWGELGRQLQLTGRAGLQGLGDVADFVAAPARMALNLLGANIQGRTGEAVADAVGLARPQTPEERTIGAAAEAVAGLGVPIAGGQALMNSSLNVVRQNIGRLLAGNPKLQAALSALSGTAGQMAEESGAETGGQIAASVGAPLAAAGLAKPAATGLRRLGEIAHPMLSEQGALRAAGRVATDVAGERAPAISAALQTEVPMLTAGQVGAKQGSAEFAGLERLVGSHQPSVFGPFGTVERGQQTALDDLWAQLNARTSPAREAALTQANAVGGLGVGNLSMEIAAMKADPNLSNRTAQTMLNWVDKELIRIADPGTGEVNARALYNLRKDLGLKIKDWSSSPKWDKKTSAGTLGAIQRKLDWELDNALGNTGWSEGYIARHAQGAQEIGGLQELQEQATKMGAAGMAKAGNIAKLAEAPVHLPNLLERSVMLTNALLRAGQGYGGERTTLKLADLMQPQGKAQLGQLISEELKRRGGRVTFGEAMRQAAKAGTYNEMFD